MTPQCFFTGGHPLSDYESEASDLAKSKAILVFLDLERPPSMLNFHIYLLLTLYLVVVCNK